MALGPQLSFFLLSLNDLSLFRSDRARNKEVSPSPPRDPAIVREARIKEEVPVSFQNLPRHHHHHKYQTAASKLAADAPTAADRTSKPAWQLAWRVRFHRIFRFSGHGRKPHQTAREYIIVSLLSLRVLN